MSNVLLFDFNNLGARCFFTNNQVGASTNEPDFQIWKYLVFHSIFSSIANKKLDETSEVILAVDSSPSWRKLYWPRYKENRTKAKETTDIRWDLYYPIFHEYLDEIKNMLPWKVLKVNNCEADDIIGVITRDKQKKIIVISNDEDYLQVCSDNVRVWKPITKTFMEHGDRDLFINKKCLTGQNKDFILNVKTPLTWDKERDGKKPQLGEKAAEKIIASGLDKWLQENKLEERFKVNKILMDFNMIPPMLVSKVEKDLSSYQLPNKHYILEFIKKYGFREYIEKFDYVDKLLSKLN